MTTWLKPASSWDIRGPPAAALHANSLTRLNYAEFRDDAFHKTEVSVMPTHEDAHPPSRASGRRIKASSRSPAPSPAGRGTSRAAPVTGHSSKTTVKHRILQTAPGTPRQIPYSA